MIGVRMPMAILAGLLLTACATAESTGAPAESQLWREFVEARETGGEALLPDF